MSLKKLFRQEVLDLPPYHLDEHPGVKLNQNESPWDLPVGLKAKVIENLLKAPWNRYPLGDLLLLKKKMAKFLNVWPDNLVFANGSNVLVQALTIASSVGKKIMVTDPTFAVYEIEGKLLGNKIIRVPLEDDFSLPADKFLNVLRKERPGIVFIANPNAPTGNLFDPKALRRIIEASPGLVVIDEAYYPFSEFTVMDWIKEYDHLVVMRTFSKAFALGGIRLGYIVAEPEVATQVQKCLLPFCIGRPALITALTVLDHAGYVEENAQRIRAERERLFAALEKIKNIKAYPSRANFILFEVEKAEEIFKKLLEGGVIVRQVGDGRRLTQTLRVTVGAPEENTAFLKALSEVV
ncbi:MAG: histidinol-phosphate transaminase [Deltaproteobacteria bacterium]|nr:histidinol-phosphate transaminase [Deltaproteobacteria bacterium]